MKVPFFIFSGLLSRMDKACPELADKRNPQLSYCQFILLKLSYLQHQSLQTQFGCSGYKSDMGGNRFAMTIDETGLKIEELHGLQCTLGKEFLGSYHRKNAPVSGKHLSNMYQKKI